MVLNYEYIMIKKIFLFNFCVTNNSLTNKAIILYPSCVIVL